MKPNFKYIGHRGTRVGFDENTISAFEKVIEYGANYIEFDIQKTKDGKLIILHDYSLERTTNGSGLLREYTYQEIKNLRTKKKREQIPNLADLLDILKGKTKFIIELKGENVRNELLSLVNKKDLINDCVFSGRCLGDLLSIKLNYPESKICYNITKGRDITLKKILNLGKKKKLSEKPDLISLKSNLITSQFIDICHNNNILTLSWDFINYKNAIDNIKSLVNSGIDGILFDNYKNIPIIKRWVERD